MSGIFDVFRGSAFSDGGQLLLPGDDDYDKVRGVWNGAIDRRPAAIARCTSAAEVAAALAFGRRSGLTMSIRGGGHNFAGTAVCEGGLMIDLGLMKGVHI